MRRPHITVARLMVAVAIAGRCMGASRVPPVLGLITSCWAGLTIVRTFAATDGRRAAGPSLLPGQFGGLLLDSMVVALILLVTAGLTFACAVLFVAAGHAIVRAAVGSGGPVVFAIDVLFGVVAGLLAVATVASRLRRDLWPPGDGVATRPDGLSDHAASDPPLPVTPDPPGPK